MKELFKDLITKTFPQLEVLTYDNGAFYIGIKDTKVSMVIDTNEFPTWKIFRKQIFVGVERAIDEVKNTM